MSLRVVVSGTDTGIGKTVFCAALTDALGAGYWKPVQSGLEEKTDSAMVADLGGIPAHRIFPEAWRLRTPASPHLSAAVDRVRIDPEKLNPPKTSLPLVIEGAGGLLVPLARDALFADVFARWQLPVVLCARTALGTINHTLLSIEAMRSRQIPILGIAFVGDAHSDTESIIPELGRVRRLGRLPFLDPLTPERLRHAFRAHFELAAFQEGCPG